MTAKHYPKSAHLERETSKSTAAYVSWDGKMGEDVKAMAQFSEAVSEFTGFQRSQGRWNQDLSNLQTNVSGRPGLSKSDYYAFRPEEAPAGNYKGMMCDAEKAYQNTGLIRNVIDLMADFACQGIRLVHPNQRIEKFVQNWFARVNGKDRSERFLNNLYRTGNVVVRKQTAKIKVKSKESLYKSVAADNIEIQQQTVKKNEIPWKYNFINPAIVEVVGGQLASFSTNPRYGVKLPRNLARLINSPKTEEERALVKELPDEVKQAAKTNKLVIIPSDKVSTYYYKKDDWQAWAFPMIYSIMDDIVVLDKLRLADMAALDGAISNIRIFKIGSLEHKIVPTKVAAAKLSEVLQSNVGGGTMDLIWGPDIELIESKTTVHQFLGEEKYRPHLNAIYAGLGIPPTLTGTAGASGTTNNLISLKTLITRLEYGRDQLKRFWEKEIAEVQKAMGFRFPAKVEFAHANLGDEVAEKALLIQLADRNIVSDERIQHIFGGDPDLEKIRLNRENRNRKDGKMVPKSGPFYDPQFGDSLKKMALQQDQLTPGEVGLREDSPLRDMRVYPRKDNEKLNMERQAELMPKPAPGGTGGPDPKKKGEPQQGRPMNSKDTKKRKEKRFVPKTKASVEIWAHYVQTAIAEFLDPLILKMYGKKDKRSLTHKEMDHAEQLKFGVLCNLAPLQRVDEQDIEQALNYNIPADAYKMYTSWSKDISQEVDRALTLDELKRIQTSVYTEYKESGV